MAPTSNPTISTNTPAYEYILPFIVGVLLLLSILILLMLPSLQDKIYKSLCRFITRVRTLLTSPHDEALPTHTKKPTMSQITTTPATLPILSSARTPPFKPTMTTIRELHIEDEGSVFSDVSLDSDELELKRGSGMTFVAARPVYVISFHGVVGA